jgi:hypothetical protein
MQLNNLRKYFFYRYEYLVISFVLPIAWIFFEKYFKHVSLNRKFIPPEKNLFNSATIFVKHIEENKDVRHTLLPLKSVKSWAESSLNIKSVNTCTNSKDINSEIVIITGDWFKQTKPHLKFFIPAFRLAREINKQKKPIWFMAGDTYSLHVIISASILVANCGGSIILQQNTREEALKFGIPFPSGPHIWLLNPGNLYLFTSEIPWNSRPDQIIFAVTGDDKRLLFYEKVHKNFLKYGWKVIPGHRQYSWSSYRDLMKHTKLNIILSLRQSSVDKRLRFLRKHSSEFVVSSRVFEGFCAGNLVITNVNPILEKLGFVKNIHYLDVNDFDQDSFQMPSNESFQSIAQAGSEFFHHLVKNIV